VEAADAARHLAEIAYRLRLKEDPYRARAFSTAAYGVLRQRPDLGRLHAGGRLESLAGVGKGIAKVLGDIVENGGSAYLDRLREETGEPHRGPPTSTLDFRAYQGDVHSHSTWSDGKATVLEMACAARERGYRYLAVTDHSPRIPMVHGLGPERLAAQREEIARAQAEVADVQILRGIEVDINEDGSLDLPDDALAELDVVIASPHAGLRMDASAQTERMLRAIEHPHVDIVGHPTGRRPGARKGATYDVERVFRRAAECGVALELDADPGRVDLSPEHARLAADLGCRFTFDSDAHAPVELLSVELGLWCPQLADLPPDRILNWLPAADLRRTLRR
jgi:histidinol phosphatase-like PHP family hydrolase